MAGGRLTLDDLAGSQLIGGPPDPAPKPARLRPEDLEGSQVVGGGPTVDMGPEARRARAGMAPSARHQTSEQAGTSAGFQTAVDLQSEAVPIPGIGPDMVPPEIKALREKMLSRVPHRIATFQEPEREQAPPEHYNLLPGGSVTGMLASPAEGGPPDSAYQEGVDPNRKHRSIRELRPEFREAWKGRFYELDQFERDPVAQMAIAGPAGRLAGQMAAPVLARTAAGITKAGLPTAGRLVAAAGPGAVEGAAAGKFVGGDADTGAVIGAAVPLLGAAAGGLAQRIGKSAKASTRTAAKQGITTGEQNAGIRLTKKFRGAGGTDDQFVDDLLERRPDLEKIAAIKGKSSPAKVGAEVTKTLGRKLDAIDEIYTAMGEVDRLVTPQNIADGFLKKIGDAVASGDQEALRILRQERAAFMREYKNFGKLSPETMRGLKAGAGKTAWGGSRTPENVRMDIWRVYADAIETQAKGTPGVDPAKLRQLNKDAQILTAAKNALDERAVMQAANRTSIGEHATRAALIAGGLGSGSLEGVATGIAATPIIRALGQTKRRAVAGLAGLADTPTALPGAAPAAALEALGDRPRR